MTDSTRPRLRLGLRGTGRPSGLWRRALAYVLAPLLLFSGTTVGAQPAAERTIGAVEFKDLQTLSEETLLYYLGLQVGQPLREEQLNENIKKLWARGLVDDIRIESEPVAGGAPTPGNAVRLIITVKERPLLRSLDYQGLKRLSRTDIQDKISSLRIQVREGDPLSLGELQRVKALIEEMYKEKGYRFAQASYAVEDLTSNEKRVTFTVDEGDRVRISDIEFEGNEVFNDLRLRYAMKKTKETGPITRFSKKDIYNPASLQEDLDNVRDLYRGAGYKNVVIGEPQIEVRAKRPDAAEPVDQKRRLVLTIPIEEGDRWRFGTVTLDGNKIYSDEILLSVFEHQPGGWLRSKIVDDGVKAVQDLYHNSGYIFARVEPELVERKDTSDQVADVVVHVNEGDQYKVGRIEFEGNDRTMDKVLRRELRLQEGRVVSIGAVRNSITKVNQLGYFKLDEQDPVKIDYDGENKQVNLLFKGEEAERTELQFGGGWSEFEDFFGQFAINTKNFLGRGEQVGVSVQAGGIRDVLDVSYFIPWFLDRPQSVGFRAFDQDLDYDILTALGNQRTRTTSRGGEVTYGRNLGLFQQMSASYNRTLYKDEATILGGTSGTLTSRLEIDTSSVRPIYVYDSRDNPFEPTRGRRLTLATEYAGGFLGGDNYFIRPEVTFSLFQPISIGPRRQVFAFNVEGGLVDPFGGRDSHPPGALLPRRREQHPRPSLALDHGARPQDGRAADRPGSDPAGRRPLPAGQSGVPFPARRPVPHPALRRCRAGLRRGPVVRPLPAALHRRRRAAGAGAGLRGAAALHLRLQPGRAAGRPVRGLPVQYRNQLLIPSFRFEQRTEGEHVPMSHPNRFLRPAGLGLALGLLALGLAPAAFAQAPAAPAARPAGQPKIAVIDTERILLESASGKKALADLKKLQEAKEGELRTRQQEIKDLQAKISDGRLSLAQDKLAEMDKQLEDKVIALRRLQDDATRELNKRKDDVLRHDRPAGDAGDQPGRQGAGLHADLPQVRERPDLRRRGGGHHRVRHPAAGRRGHPGQITRALSSGRSRRAGRRAGRRGSGPPRRVDPGAGDRRSGRPLAAQGPALPPAGRGEPRRRAARGAGPRGSPAATCWWRTTRRRPSAGCSGCSTRGSRARRGSIPPRWSRRAPRSIPRPMSAPTR